MASALVAVASATGLPIGEAAAPLQPPPTAPGGTGASGILAEQAAVVQGDHAGAIASSQGLLAVARAELAAAQARAAADQSAADDATRRAGADEALVAGDANRSKADARARLAATASVAADESRLRAVAVELYVSPGDASVGPAGPTLQQAQRELDAEAMLSIGSGTLAAGLRQDRSDLRAAVRAVEADAARTATDEAALAADSLLRDRRAVVLTADAATVSASATAVSADQSTAASASAALVSAEAAVANPPGAPDDGSPTIVGASALSAQQLVGWYDTTGYSDLTAAPITQLAAWYSSEGGAEGVRGDLAFAQAIVETAGFSSSDAVDANNFAGIGHCDSCATGLPFPSPQLGVRGQVQLLHSYADGPLTATQLANPLVVASLAPQSQPDKGCCQTWQSLTGKWATDPLYGHTILTVYQRMLAYALTHLDP